MTRLEMCAEMARRKVRFHPDEEWDSIKLWGLFSWGAIFRFLKEGILKTDMKKENVTVWVRPTKWLWEEEIKPLVEKYSLEELTSMAGW